MKNEDKKVERKKKMILENVSITAVFKKKRMDKKTATTKAAIKKGKENQRGHSVSCANTHAERGSGRWIHEF